MRPCMICPAAPPLPACATERGAPRMQASVCGGVLMMPTRVWKLTVLCLAVSASLFLGIAGAQAQPAAGQAKVDRLVMGLIEKYRDYWRPWINGSPDHMIQHDPVFEWLFEVDAESG